MRALPLERDELNIARILGYTRAGLLEVPGRAGAAAPGAASSSGCCGRGSTRRPRASLKSAWFSALRDTAQSPAVLDWLERVWRKTEPVPGLPLAEPDYITLALELAVREVPAWQEILDQQLARTRESRSQGALRVRPAGARRRDQAMRDAFFES